MGEVRGSEATLAGAGPLIQAEEEPQGSFGQPWASKAKARQTQNLQQLL